MDKARIIVVLKQTQPMIESRINAAFVAYQPMVRVKSSLFYERSFAATLLFKDAGKELVAVWIHTTALNFPMALCWQLFFAGPFVRNVFGFFVKKFSKDSHAVTKQAA
ncbi:hypothetical protein [Butyrivibrio sp. WCD3002]|uniref:hypothetical protein n=1 Tax=Butyrivibrio sp. WCD3002 TaxID=1280676 RepID=UPI00047A37FE|nr:hypothetical protein [Butyrivibrio sp. WCD3002]